MEPRTLAPFGRRTLTVVERTELGAYVVLAVEDPDGPTPRAGQFYMLAAAQRWGGRAGERPDAGRRSPEGDGGPPERGADGSRRLSA